MIITLVTQSSRSRYVDIPARLRVHFTNAINQDARRYARFPCFLSHRFPITLVQHTPTDKVESAKWHGERMETDCRNSGRKCISDLIIFNLYFLLEKCESAESHDGK